MTYEIAFWIWLFVAGTMFVAIIPGPDLDEVTGACVLAIFWPVVIPGLFVRFVLHRKR